MGYVVPIAYSFYSLYHERFHLPKTPLISRVEFFNKGNRLQAYNESQQEKERESAMKQKYDFPEHFGQVIDIKV